MINYLRKKIKYILIVLIVVVAGSLFVIFSKYRDTKQNPLPQKIISSIHFSLFYLSYLPKGFGIDKSTFTTKDGAIIFTYKDQYQDDTIYVSEEKKPIGISINGFATQEIYKPTTLTNKYGSASFGTLKQSPTTSIISFISNQTWVIINTNDQIQPPTLKQIAQGITIVKS